LILFLIGVLITECFEFRTLPYVTKAPASGIDGQARRSAARRSLDAIAIERDHIIGDRIRPQPCIARVRRVSPAAVDYGRFRPPVYVLRKQPIRWYVKNVFQGRF